MSRILWFDLETTGLDIPTLEILEIGCVLTTGPEDGLEEISTFHGLVYPAGGVNVLRGMEPYVEQMHHASGLLADVVSHGDPLEEVGLQWLMWMSEQSLVADVIAGGSGIDRYDMPIIERIYPGIYGKFHWRRLDMSPTKQLLDLIGRQDLIPEVTGTVHRALDDARMAINLCRSISAHLSLEAVQE